jgi:hypothetical protein
LPFVNNAIPAGETNNYGGYNNVAAVNDLSDLFAPGAIPQAPSFSVTHTPSAFNSHTGRTLQLVHVQNVGTSAVSGPVWLVLDDLIPGVALLDAAGTSGVLAPLGSPYVSVPLGGDGVLRPFETKTVALEFVGNGGADLQYNPRVLNVTPAP